MKIKKKSYYNMLQNNGYLFVLPVLLFFLIFLIYPILSSFYYSLFDWNLVGPKIFVGLKNFINLFKDARFLNSFKVTFHFTFVSVLIIMFLSFWIALAFTAKIKFKNIFQAFVFLPVILMTVAIAVAWEFMFNSTGLISYGFIKFFNLKIPWLTSVKITPYTMIIVYVWKYTGYYMVIFLAGLLNIPDVYYEAADMDGASFFSKLRYITIPQLKNTIILAFLSCVLFSFGTFAQQYVMTEGGPSRSTEVLTLLIYQQAFEYSRYGYASAISVVFFLTLLFFSIFQLRIFKPNTE